MLISPPTGWTVPSAGTIEGQVTPQIDLAELLFIAIRSGDLTALGQLLADHPGLESAPLGGRHSTRTPLHIVADWPGYFPNGPRVVRLLTEAGADPSARSPGDETPLHWAASSDDSDVANALIDAGADVDAPDGSIGTPLANAVGYGCWHVARGADLNWVPDYAEGTPLDAASSASTRQENVVSWLRTLGARSSHTDDTPR